MPSGDGERARHQLMADSMSVMCRAAIVCLRRIARRRPELCYPVTMMQSRSLWGGAAALAFLLALAGGCSTTPAPKPPPPPPARIEQAGKKAITVSVAESGA